MTQRPDLGAMPGGRAQRIVNGMTTAMISQNCVRTRRVTRGLAVVAATGATYTVWTAAHQILGVDLELHNGSVVSATAVVVATVLAGLAGWALLALLEHFASRAWPWIALGVLVISLAGPLGSAVGAGATAALIAMHLVAGAVLIPLMTSSSTRRRPVRPA